MKRAWLKDMAILVCALALLTAIFLPFAPERNIAQPQLAPVMPCSGGGIILQEGKALVDINTADLATIAGLPGVGETLARRIVDYRAAYGPFAAMEELLNVEGIGEKKLEAIRAEAAIRP